MKDKLEIEVGQVFSTPTKTLTDAHFLFFSGLTGDNHPIHYDVEYAKSTKFGAPLAHGLLLAGMTALGGSDASFQIDGLVFVEQGSRFLKPAKIGDTIHTTLTVEKIWHVPRTCPVSTFSSTMTISSSSMPSLVRLSALTFASFESISAPSAF